MKYKAACSIGAYASDSDIKVACKAQSAPAFLQSAPAQQLPSTNSH